MTDRLAVVSALSLPLLTLAIACTDTSSQESSATPSDSARVEVVRSQSPTWRAGEEWTVAENPVVDIGKLDGPDADLFSGRVAAAWKPDGDIVVGDGSSRLRFLSPEGELEKIVGRSGQGPGEFLSIQSVHVGPDDSLYVVDGGGDRVSVHTPDGAFVRIVTLEPAEGSVHAWPIGVAGSHIVAAGGSVSFTPAKLGPQRDTTRLHLYDAQGTYLARIAVEPAAMRWAFSSGGMLDWPYQPFTVDPFMVVGGGRIYMSSGRDPEIRVWDDAGELVREIRWTPERRPVDASVKAELRAAEAARTSTGELAPRREAFLRETDYPDELPLADRMVVASDGSLWLRSYSFRDEPRPWMVFDPSGVLLGSVSMPAGLDPRVIHDDEILGVHRDDLGVARVRVHRILRE